MYGSPGIIIEYQNMCKIRWWLSVEVGGGIELGLEFPRGEHAQQKQVEVEGIPVCNRGIVGDQRHKVHDCFLVSHDLYVINDKG